MRERQTTKTASLPDAGESSSTDPINVGAFNIGGRCELVIDVPVTPDLADGKDIDIELEESDTADGSYTPVPTTGGMKVTGADGAGGEAQKFRLFLPPVHKAFIRATATAEADAEDNSDVEFTLAVEL